MNHWVIKLEFAYDYACTHVLNIFQSFLGGTERRELCSNTNELYELGKE